jgi:hypothetical protein
MIPVVTLILNLMQSLLPLIGNSAGLAKIIETLIQLLPIIANEVSDLLPMVKNIIAALKNHDAVTPDQIAQLSALDAQVDAAFDAAAAAAEAEDGSTTT